MRFVWKSLTAVLVSIAVAWAPTAFSAPNAVGDTGVVLSPSQGPRGTSVHVGYGSCFVKDPDGTSPGTITSLTWDGAALAFTPSHTGLTGGADFTVPGKAASGPHIVRATCDNGAGGISDEASFAVTTTDDGHGNGDGDESPGGNGDGGENGDGDGSTPAYSPEIRLDPLVVLPGGSVAVHGSGFGRCQTKRQAGSIDIAVNRVTITAARVDAAKGGFEAKIPIPANAIPREYTVGATCAADESIHAEATFAVLPSQPGVPVLTLTPTQGPSETAVTAAGSGFRCPRVDLSWDDSDLTSTDTADDGTFETDFDVPADSAATAHTVRAECAQESRTSAEADFTVADTGTNSTANGGGNTPGTTDGGNIGGPDGTGGTNGGNGETTPVGLVVGPSAVGAVLLLAALFALLNHRHRGPRWVRNHIRTTLRPATGTADLLERRDDGSENRTVRLEPHTDPGDQRLD